MNKRFAKLFAVLAAVCLIFSLAACAPETQEGEKSITVLVDMRQYEGEIAPSEGFTGYTDKVKTLTIKTDAKYLEQVLSELMADKQLEFSGSQSSYGMMIDKVDNVSLDYVKDGRYLGVFCNDDDALVANQQQSHECGEYTLWYCNYGVTTLPVKDGLVYALVVLPAEAM